ncbi:MAG: radical SAM protein [Chloroflexi bacterium]|nr:radical SAM protein [Chloroflexota bacterium]
MKTLLINPPYPFSEIPIMPMGLAYIAAVLEQKGHDVEVLDLLVSRYSKEKIKHKLEQYKPDIVGLTSVTMNYPIASDIIKYCKSIDKDLITVIGGPHVTFDTVDTLTKAPWIDIIVRGEGEQTILDIVNGKKPGEIDGIAYRDKNDGIKITKERSLIQDLDELPFPAKHLFPISRYHALDVHASIITGRGCPFNCVFCVGSKMGGRRVRFRSPRLVIDEVEQALSSGFKEINFEDDSLTVNHKHLYAICDEITARGLKFNWSAFSRADTVNPEMLRRMKQTGCTWLLYGVESGNQHILDLVKKKITLDKVREGVKMAREAGISVQASFIMGLPGETKETMKQSLEFGKSLGTSYGFHVLTPFPGTEVREKSEEYGIEILTNDWLKYDCNRPITRTREASVEDVTAHLQIYFHELKQYMAALSKESDAGDGEFARTKRRRQLAAALLKEDVIESVGPVKSETKPVEGLTAKLAELVPYSQNQIKEGITDWVERGLLKYDKRDGHLFWRWS